ncbi:hypothetical protein [Galbibacter sp. BG1]
MSIKLGFTFYPKDWWTSDSFFELSEVERYFFLEMLFTMYENEGYLKNDIALFNRRIRTNIDSKTWDKLTSKFIREDKKGFTHKSVNKRLKRKAASQENGKKGGRPPEVDGPENEYINKKLKDLSRDEIPEEEQKFFDIAVSFQKLFIKNLKEKNSPSTHQNNATYKGYVTPIKLMISKNECTREQIKDIYRYLNSKEGEFWKPNILSTSKLREKATELLMKYNTVKNKTITQPSKKQIGPERI